MKPKQQNIWSSHSVFSKQELNYCGENPTLFHILKWLPETLEKPFNNKYIRVQRVLLDCKCLFHPYGFQFLKAQT